MRLHRSGAELRASAVFAEEILAEGCASGRGRRRARGPARTPPTGGTAALEGMIRRLDEAVTAARAQPEWSRCGRHRGRRDQRSASSQSSSTQGSSALLRRVPVLPDCGPSPYPRLAKPFPRPRRSSRDSVVFTEAAAPEGRLPEPIVGAPTWDAAGSEVAPGSAGATSGPLFSGTRRRRPLVPRASAGTSRFASPGADDEW
jgi:hypothetical protein